MAEDDHGHEAVYDASAHAWDVERQGRFPERFLIQRLVAGLPRGAAVLDLGCGSGQPIAAFLAEQGFLVTGVDFSARMLALAAARLPAQRFVRQDMRMLSLGQRFQAVVAWDSFFHLWASEQLVLIPRIAEHLCAGGLFLFTCGPDAARRGAGWPAGLSFTPLCRGKDMPMVWRSRA
ncbi:class I SAM-dependent DNA methyltransferase [Thioclava sp. FR2]|uniref:class I SAM-dependent DNA methyltransferase n=1 Tax=Thioclava sp. FR2 TaxID=3445780 RepID=UPI003EBEAC7B